MERYDAMLDKNVAGSVKVTEEGLYIRFQCACNLPDSEIYKLMVFCNDQSVELGVCVPQGSCFGLDTRIARKRLGKGRLRFCIFPAHTSPEVSVVPVEPEKPFGYLQMLTNAHLQIRNNHYFVVMPKMKP